jgi:hypothetical protein
MVTNVVENVFTVALGPMFAALPADAVQRLIDLPVDPVLQARVDYLADRANEGLITEAESDEYRRIIYAYDVLSILQAQAALRLRNTSAP